MSLKRNIVANYFGGIVVVAAPVLALPWYLAHLGPAQFGLISFISMLQAVLGFLDAGMSQALVREIAVRFDASENARQKTALLLFGFERVYWICALFIGGVAWLLADRIASQWLQLGTLPMAAGVIAIEGAAAIFVAQFPGSIYRSLLVGIQAQVTLNGVMTGAALLRQVGGVLVVSLWPELSTYVIWHACVVLLETLTRRYLAWKRVGVERRRLNWSAEELLPVWRVAATMSGAALLGAITVQLDKIVLSRMVPLDQFGFYSVASSVATGLLMLIYPLVQAVLPRAIQLRGQPTALRLLSLRLMGLIAAAVFGGALVFLLAGHWLLTVWLKNAVAVTTIYPLLAVLLVGTALNAFYNVGYVNWLVHKKVRRVLQVNVLAFVLAVAVTPPLVMWHGTMGATFGWLASNLIGLLLSLEWIRRKPDEKNS